jgi:hypothetical protein
MSIILGENRERPNSDRKRMFYIPKASWSPSLAELIFSASTSQ